MKQFALGVKVGRTKKSTFDEYWSKRIALKLFGVYACIVVGIDIAICSATLLSSTPDHRDQPQSSGARLRQGQEEDKTRTQSRATELRGAAKTRTRGGQEEDKAQPQRTRGGQGRTQSPATEDKRRTRPGHRTDPSHRGQEEDKAWTQSPATEPSHRAQPQSSAARPVSVASSFVSKIEPQQKTVWGKNSLVRGLKYGRRSEASGDPS